MNIVAHNLSAMNAQRQFGLVTNRRAKATEKLSSGFKINRAADDAAGLSISEKMRRQIRGLTQGVQNTQEGISLCQVADGALNEVTDMLHRITELSVKAATGTNSQEDREYIQQEISQLLAEIDRIGENTTFNEQPVFKGTLDQILNPDGSVGSMDDIEFGHLTLADVNLGKTPIVQGENMDMLHLQAIVDNADLALNGQSFNLIYGNGSTSNSSIRITDANDVTTTVQIGALQVTDFTTNGANSWSRKATYTNGTTEIGITQTVTLESPSADEKNYVISYEFTKSADVANLEFMFHTDTAYNNKDNVEGYYIDGTKVDKTCMYSQTDSPLTDGVTNDNLHVGTIPDSYSIVDVDSALAFAEKISFDGRKPDSLSIGYYDLIDDWDYYSQLDQRLGSGTNRTDLGFSLYYNLGDLSGEDSITFNYGISSAKDDENLKDVDITWNEEPMSQHNEKLSVWIQSGVESGDGMYVTIDEMSTDTLGIRGINLSTVDGANQANIAVKEALKKVSSNRATIGAQQNRLEHIVANEENIIENTTSAESLIRDTDMAKVMVEYSNLGILEQAGQAMMAQANQSNAGILNLLQ